MKHIKKNGLRFLLGIELCIFAWIYIRGPHGIKALSQLKHENALLIADIDSLRSDVQNLEHTIIALQTHSFYKEKIAREQLQMARKDEIIYYY